MKNIFLFTNSAVFGRDELFPHLSPFIRHWRSLRSESTAPPPLFFVSVDVSRAFDTIGQERLLGILQLVLQQNAYMLRRYSTVVHAGGRPRASFRTHVASETDYDPFERIAEGLCASSASRSGTGWGVKKSVLADHGKPNVLHRDALLADLREHLLNNLIKIGKQFYRTKRGIPQVSVRSK